MKAADRPKTDRTGVAVVVQHSGWTKARDFILAQVTAGPTFLALLAWNGTGKTALLQALIEPLQQRGLTVVWVPHGDLPWEAEAGSVVMIDEAARMGEAELAAVAARRDLSVILADLPGFDERLAELREPPAVITLRPLPPHELDDFVRAWLSALGEAAPGEADLAWLAEQSGGVPGLLVPLLRSRPRPRARAAKAPPIDRPRERLLQPNDTERSPSPRAAAAGRRVAARPALSAAVGLALLLATPAGLQDTPKTVTPSSLPAHVFEVTLAPEAASPTVMAGLAPTEPTSATAVAEVAEPDTPPTGRSTPDMPAAAVSPPAPPAIAEEPHDLPALPAPTPGPVEQSAALARAPANRSAGLILVAQPGDTMASLYARIYRGRTPLPYDEVLAANRAPFKAGAMVIFPAPPGGWTPGR